MDKNVKNTLSLKEIKSLITPKLKEKKSKGGKKAT